jgi:hypothetical protein
MIVSTPGMPNYTAPDTPKLQECTGEKMLKPQRIGMIAVKIAD